MNPFKGEAKDVFLAAIAWQDGGLLLVLVILSYNKTSEKKLFSYSSKMG